MKNMNLKTIRGFIVILALMVFSGGLGWELGHRDVSFQWQNYKPQFSVIDKEPPVAQTIDFKLFWNVWDRLGKDYFDKSKVDAQRMVWGAISGMTQALGDPYTVFLPPEENKAFKEELAGIKFEGIGAQLGVKDKMIVVIAPLKGSPAEKAGIWAGDFILKVDGKETANWTLPEAVAKIRGPKGTKVVLTIGRQGQDKPKDIEVVRDTILVKSVEFEIKNNIAILKLSRFGDDTNQEWEKTIKTLNLGNISGVVLDLRNNPGGYLGGAVFIASEFLKDGVVVVQEKSSGEKDTFTVNRKGRLTDVPLVVLINKGSASASEIVAVALKERGRAKLVGEATFGKGTIQEAQDLEGGAGLHVTTARWLTPLGTFVNGAGIKPDVEVAADESDQTRDLQLEKALEILI